MGRGACTNPEILNDYLIYFRYASERLNKFSNYINFIVLAENADSIWLEENFAIIVSENNIC